MIKEIKGIRLQIGDEKDSWDDIMDISELEVRTTMFPRYMSTDELNALAAEIHADNAKWWHDLESGERLDRNKGEMLMLMISEVSEAMEGERKNLNDTHLTKRKMAEVELADVLIRTFDFSGGFGYRLFETGTVMNSDNRAECLLLIVNAFIQAYHAIYDDNRHMVNTSLSVAISAVYSYARKFGYDVNAAMAEKRAYNAVREDHSIEHRLAEGGKKW